MTHALRSKFPEYRRKKFRVFKSNVETIVEFEQGKSLKKNIGNNDTPQTVSSDSGPEDDQCDDRSSSIIKNSMNKTLSELYSNDGQDYTDRDHGENKSSKIPKTEFVKGLVLNARNNSTQNVSVESVNGVPKRKNPLGTRSKAVSSNGSLKDAEMIDLSNDEELLSQKQSGKIIESTPYGIPRHKKGSDNDCRLLINQISSPIPSASKQSAVNGPIIGKRLKGVGNKKIPVVESNVTFADLGGIDSTLIKVLDLLLHLKHPEIYERIGVNPPRGFLLHGPPGCGKTLLANAIAGQLQLPLIKLAATEVVSGVSGESEGKLRELFEQAMENAPCILFIDEIDSITQRRDNAHKGMESRIVGQLLACMDELNEKGNNKEGHVVVIGATNRPDTLDPALRRAGRFEREISLGIPDEKARANILKVMTSKLNLQKDFELQALARKCPGYVGADMASLCREAATSAVNRIFKQLHSTSNISFMKPQKHNEDYTKEKLTSLLHWLDVSAPLSDEQLASVCIDMTDFDTALKVVQPSAKREGFATVPDVTWDDIGALNDVREELELSILGPVHHPEATKALGLNAPMGILLCGPPGCGKTLLAKAVANQAGINFISVKGPELLNMYVGESERAVRQVFQRARNSAPCVIFFDEIDALCPRRSSTSGGENSARVVNQLLTEMDGMEGRGEGVFIMGATNRVDILDPAVLRPGRLQKILFVDLPSPSDRVDILRAITSHGTRPRLAPDVDFDTLAHSDKCEFFTGADMAALVTEASNASFKEHILAESRRGKQQLEPAFNMDIKVSAKHFKMAFSKVRTSVSFKERKKYQEMKKLYSVCTPKDATNDSSKTRYKDEDMGIDAILSEERGRSLSQEPSVDEQNSENENLIQNEIGVKTVESDVQVHRNEVEHSMDELEDAPIQKECVSSPSDTVAIGSVQVAGLQSSPKPPSPQNMRISESPEVEGNIV